MLGKGNLRILIADDCADLRRLFQAVSKSLGLHVLLAADGEEAYSLFMEHDPDIVVSDYDMPKMNGIDLIKKILLISTDTHTILLTGVGNEQVAIDALESGACLYLKKPVDTASLKKVLTQETDAIIRQRQLMNISMLIQERKMKLSFDTNVYKIPDIIALLIEKVEAYLPSHDLLKVELGLSELITNAIEHGNLGISYAEKSEALKNNELEDLYKIKLSKNDCQKKQVAITFYMNSNYCEWEIIDQGEGFDWQKQPSPCIGDKLLCLHGRGIFISKIQFDEIEYSGKGNIVKARKYRIKKND